MPYPIGHSLVGAAIAKKTDLPLWLVIILANLPDIDFLFGIVKGNLLMFHDNGIALAYQPWLIIAVLLVFVTISKLKHIRYSTQSIVVMVLIVASHILLDRFTPQLPYRIDVAHGTNGFWDFVFTYILNPDFLWNNFLDLLFYGVIYIVVVKFIFKEKLSPFEEKKKKR